MNIIEKIKKPRLSFDEFASFNIRFVKDTYPEFRDYFNNNFNQYIKNETLAAKIINLCFFIAIDVNSSTNFRKTLYEIFEKFLKENNYINLANAGLEKDLIFYQSIALPSKFGIQVEDFYYRIIEYIISDENNKVELIKDLLIDPHQEADFKYLFTRAENEYRVWMKILSEDFNLKNMV